MRKYANAKDVLSKQLYEQLKEEFTGLLYVPGDNGIDRKKPEIIVSLAKQGAQTKEIAGIVGMSPRRVNQILAGKRKRKVEWVWSGEAK